MQEELLTWHQDGFRARGYKNPSGLFSQSLYLNPSRVFVKSEPKTAQNHRQMAPAKIVGIEAS